MKQIQVKVPSTQSVVVEDMVKKYELEATQIQTMNEEMMFFINIHDNQSNTLLHEFKARGVGVVFGNITLSTVNLHLSNQGSSSQVKRSEAANIEEILADVEQSASMSITYLALVILSGALAAFGLIGNSVVIIIGSMIVAPLLGPLALASIGFIMPQRNVLRKGLTAEFVGVLLTIVVGFTIGIIFKIDGHTEEMIGRGVKADPNNIAFAVVSGIAAGVVIAKGQGLSIVGVAIAASLAPPAANIGLYLALAQRNVDISPYNPMDGALLAAALLFINIFAINAACSIIFALYRLPARAGMSKRRTSKVRRTNTILTIIIIFAFIGLSIFFISILDQADSV